MDPSQFYYGLGPDAIQPIQNPKFFNADDQGRPINTNANVFIGLNFQGEQRAYPLYVLKSHEVVNDEVNGVPIAVVYWPLHNLTAVYSRKIKTEGLYKIFTLSASGWVYQTTFVLYDYESESLWYPFPDSGVLKCVNGVYADRILSTIPSETMRWSEWVQKYPESKFLKYP